jgi:hypothetical protein
MYPCICFCILYSTVYTYIIYIYIYGYTRLHTHTRRFINRRYQCLIMSLKVYVVLLVSCCSYFFQLYYRRPPLSVAALGLGRAGLLLPSLTVLCCCRSRGCCFTLLSIVAPLAQVLVFNYRLCQKLVISRTPQGVNLPCLTFSDFRRKRRPRMSSEN